MTFGTEQKRHLLNTFKGCYQHSFPSGVNVYIEDDMRLVKYKGPHIETVQDYIHKKVLRKVNKILGEPTKSVSHYYKLLDRDATLPKKIFAWGKRERAMPYPEPKPGQYVLPKEGLLPVMWDELVANRQLTRREVYHLHYRAIMECYEPPVGKCVVIDGMPNRPLTKEEFKPEEYQTVYFKRTLPGDPGQVVGMSSRDVLATPVALGPRVISGACPPEAYTHNINEGDLSAFFHVNKHIRYTGCSPDVTPDQVIVIDSNDGDTVLAALLHSRDRIDPRTMRFNSRVWVLLEGQERVRKGYLDRKEKALKANKEWVDDVIDGRDIYININKLYQLIDAHPELSKAQYPQGMAVLLYILSGTDFFADFTGDQYSLFYYMNWEKCVWNTWCKHADRFSHMLLLTYSGPSRFNQPELLRRPFIDEECMLTFIYQCYAAQYGKQIKKEYKVTKVTPKMLEDYTKKFYLNVQQKKDEKEEKYQGRLSMARKKRVPPKGILIRYIRLALLNLTYWINDYRPGGPEMVDPLEIYDGFPYYGFIADPEKPGKYKLSSMCSMAKPAPEYYVPYVGKHKKNKSAVQRDPNTDAALRKKREEHDRMVRESEREERQKKMAEKLQRQKQRDQNKSKLATTGSVNEKKRRHVKGIREEGDVAPLPMFASRGGGGNNKKTKTVDSKQ